jgi:DUF1680 family protein
MRIAAFPLCFVFLLATASAFGDGAAPSNVAAATSTSAPATRPTYAPPVFAPVPLAARPFELNQVRLLDGPFKLAQERDRSYLLSLDPDRLLHNFRLNVGLPSTAQPLGGWEAPNCELRGHFVGHYLSACALMYSATNDPQLKSRLDYMIAELAKCQDAGEKAGFHQGYLSAFPESFFDRVDARKRVWAPWYTMHKIMAGVLEVYGQTGNPQAMSVVTKLADWVKFRVDRLPEEQMQASLNNEQGGMTEVMANIAGVTKKLDYLRIAQAFNHHRVIDPLAMGHDDLNFLHANTQIPKIIGAAREFELTGDPAYRRIAAFFWEDVALLRSYVFGGDSDREHFFPPTDFGKHLSVATAETCNTYNMLKLTRHLFEWQPSPLYMDFYERALYNQILASQEPDQGMMTYFISTLPGHFKTYMTPLDSFWCCSGTGIENHAKYGDTIYFHNADTLFVNLYIPSELTWQEKGFILRQETAFPDRSAVTLTCRCVNAVNMNISLRYPSWATAGMSVQVNGQELSIPQKPGCYVTLSRRWQDGDRVVINLPEQLHIEQLPNAPGQIAFMYGPLVLAGDLGDGIANDYAKDQLDYAKVSDPPVPVLVSEPQDLLSHIIPIPGQPLHFSTKDIALPADVTLEPFYQLNHRRYTIYWRSYTPEQWKIHNATTAPFDLLGPGSVH